MGWHSMVTVHDDRCVGKSTKDVSTQAFRPEQAFVHALGVVLPDI